MTNGAGPSKSSIDLGGAAPHSVRLTMLMGSEGGGKKLLHYMLSREGG